MKRIFMLIGIGLFLSANMVYADSENPFKPRPKLIISNNSNNSGNGGSINSSDLQNLKRMLSAEMVQLQNLREDVNHLKKMNTKAAIKNKKQKEKEKKAEFIGLVDGKKLFKDKDTGDYFTVSKKSVESNKNQKKGKK